VQVAGVDVVHDALLGEGEGQVVVVDPEAVVEEQEAVQGQVEAGGGDGQQLRGLGGTGDADEAGLLPHVAQVDADLLVAETVGEGVAAV
jgi:hypothetical protein